MIVSDAIKNNARLMEEYEEEVALDLIISNALEVFPELANCDNKMEVVDKLTHWLEDNRWR